MKMQCHGDFVPTRSALDKVHLVVIQPAPPDDELGLLSCNGGLYDPYKCYLQLDDEGTYFRVVEV